MFNSVRSCDDDTNEEREERAMKNKIPVEIEQVGVGIRFFRFDHEEETQTAVEGLSHTLSNEEVERRRGQR
ncbi:uncharacterized protein MONOS_14994 [Monocercomonoides exilis]|uniref:uncharacterized protein n=1 Tax=Monocercomonoides exilis TaxID=2049356 RepID=UPI00355939F7|nr:hypothetical protein MONOS_14994 [Monocercomonoides exilis]|eukprot:MONOS_14994.1-p1 / transcript=MONOS_14994.1 / gene=MONOS_14994 / organism=Monocercomonoides_exilis_PA203 / gene_product=unspecified product / transcript_product=unspecified product / location=Mono_scaffold01122:1601-1813(-) / protein_length=71 / sequence_SO=supercontig / SO=protein_coding / is_pseudo=false